MKYVNDWPQAEIIRQWFANRRRYAVREGYLANHKKRLADAARAGRVALINGVNRKKARRQQTDTDEDKSSDEQEGVEEDSEQGEGGQGGEDDEDKDEGEA